MNVVKENCFVCFTESEKNLQIVLHNDTEDQIFTNIKYAIPELATLDSDVPIYICSPCSTTIFYYCMFKKKCLENYSRWKKHYLQILKDTDTQDRLIKLQIELFNPEQELDTEENINEDPLLSSSRTEEQIFNDIKIDDNKPLLKQEPEVQVISNIKDINETVVDDNIVVKEESLTFDDPILAASRTEEQILSDLQIKIDDKPLIKQDPDVHIISNIIDINKMVVKDNIVVKEQSSTEQEELFTIKLNIKSENEDAILLSEEQNDQETVVKDNIEEESLASKDSANQELNQQPNFVNAICESVPNNEQDVGSSVTSEHNYAMNNYLTKFINYTDSQESKCIRCNESFKDKSLFGTGLQCSFCQKTYTQTNSLKRRKKSRLGKKHFKCTMCTKKFATTDSLKIHLNGHVGVKKFKCTVCDKLYVDNRNLKIHMKYYCMTKFTTITD